MFMERVEKFSQPKGTEILEVLLMFSNNRNVDLPLEIKSIILEAGNNQIDYWELVPGRVYPDYDYMARRLGLSQERPDGELFVTAKFGGTLSTTLKPREKAWLALMFFIPEKTRKANLIAEVPEKRVIDLSPK
jgi:hypothetical protein